MLIKSEEMDQEALATDIAAIVEERDIMGREAGVDLTLRIEALRRFRERGKKGKFGMIEKVAQSYRKLLDLEEDNDTFDYFQVGQLLAYAFPERIAFARPGNNAQFQLANGKIASFHHKDELAHEAWLAVAHIDEREGMGKIFMAAPLDPRDLASMVKEEESVVWDEQEDRIVAQNQLKIGRIILKSTPIQRPDSDQVITAICQWLKKHGEHVLNFNEQVIQWQYRVHCARTWNPTSDFPIVDTTHLLETCEEWLAPYIQKIRKREELEKLDLLPILQAMLSYELQQQLELIAPQKWKVPSGSMIKIEYFNDGKAPILKVRLQELFGLHKTPTVNQGKEAMVLHLLSPGFKPVQVTADLVSFWDNTYHEVKKELKRHYPKHEWPEDPWTAEAIRGVKRKK
jgi:ATP-dependent helicase HrpB